ncbi:hypothetical protein FRC12_002698 [Ceratobasidium sp. 428]|nr:hypothetical protein FRC12_002698 [Ceratobasidium sp. 428]
MMIRIVTIASLIAGAAAHFTLDYPLTRGFDEDIENRFCGGFNTPGPRSPFPLGAAGINIDSHHDSANVIALISFDPNPQNITQFSNSSGGAQLSDFIRLVKQGPACIPVNIGSLGLANVSNGTNATIQIQFDGGDGNCEWLSCLCVNAEITHFGVCFCLISVPVRRRDAREWIKRAVERVVRRERNLFTDRVSIRVKHCTHFNWGLECRCGRSRPGRTCWICGAVDCNDFVNDFSSHQMYLLGYFIEFRPWIAESFCAKAPISPRTDGASARTPETLK